jgi:hypothetical protein
VFTIGVLRFQGDKSESVSQRIALELHDSPDFQGIDVVPIRRRIASRALSLEQADSARFSAARDILRRSKADIVVWGQRIEDKVRLSWTTEYGGEGPYHGVTEGTLPPLDAQGDIKLALCALVVMQMAGASSSYDVDRVGVLLEKSKRLIDESRVNSGIRDFLRYFLACTELELVQNGDRLDLREDAMQTLDALSKTIVRSDEPDLWLKVQIACGTTIAISGEQSKDSKEIDNALLTFERARAQVNPSTNTADRALLLSEYGSTLLGSVEVDLAAADSASALESLALADSLLRESIRIAPYSNPVASLDLSSVILMEGRLMQRREYFVESIAVAKGALDGLDSLSSPIEHSAGLFVMAECHSEMALLAFGESRAQSSALAFTEYQHGLDALGARSAPLRRAQILQRFGISKWNLGDEQAGYEAVKLHLEAWRYFASLGPEWASGISQILAEELKQLDRTGLLNYLDAAHTDLLRRFELQ